MADVEVLHAPRERPEHHEGSLRSSCEVDGHDVEVVMHGWLRRGRAFDHAPRRQTHR